LTVDFLRWLESLPEGERSELAAIIAGADDRWSKVEWGVISDWVEEHGGRRAFSIWLDFEDQPPGPPPPETPIARATIYLKAPGESWEQAEGRDLTWVVKPADASKRRWQLQGRYLRRRAHTRVSIIEISYPCDMVVLSGWGHFAPPTPLHDVTFAAMLTNYSTTTRATILADFRQLATG
jgi:hypothetical protein